MISQASASSVNQPITEIIVVSGVKLSIGAPRRQPIRPLHAKQKDFDEKFDFDTLFYDALWNAKHDSIRLIGPALLNLEPLMRQSTFVAKPGNTVCAFKIRNLDRASEITVTVPVGTDRLAIKGPAGEYEIIPTPLRDNLFSGRRVIFTMSKDNPLKWINDWARYNRDVHGADAVLIYDNMSTAYSDKEMIAALAEVKGLKSIVIAKWPFRYGPSGFGERGYWDSNYSQLGMYAHARWNLLLNARSVLNSDIDELVVSRKGQSIFASAESGLTGVVSFLGDWMYGINGVTRGAELGRLSHFTDYTHKLRSRRRMKWGGMVPHGIDRCKSKWAIVPARVPETAQWHTHVIKGWLPSRIYSFDFSFRHFQEINSNWKYDRLTRVDFDPRRHVPDTELAVSLARVCWDR